MAEPKFLVVRLGSLGDIVHTLPAVAALRETFPQAEIIWLTQARWKLLAASSGLASKIWTTETREFSSVLKTIRGIRGHGFNTAIDYQGLWKSASLPFLAGVKRRIGFSSQSVREAGVPLLYTESVHAISVHVAQQNGELSKLAGARDAVANVNLQPPLVEDEASADVMAPPGAIPAEKPAEPAAIEPSKPAKRPLPPIKPQKTTSSWFGSGRKK